MVEGRGARLEARIGVTSVGAGGVSLLYVFPPPGGQLVGDPGVGSVVTGAQPRGGWDVEAEWPICGSLSATGVGVLFL